MIKTNLCLVVVLLALNAQCSVLNLASLLRGPLHASCKVDWTWPSNSCGDISKKIVDQINQWTSDENCKNGGEKCLYKLVSQTSNEIKATHETPVKHYVDDLTFTFKSLTSQSCAVNGFSTSETWYAVLDYGTNYCNLNNLITGAGLDKLKGFKEQTDNSVCTQYTTANCTIY